MSFELLHKSVSLCVISCILLISPGICCVTLFLGRHEQTCILLRQVTNDKPEYRYYQSPAWWISEFIGVTYRNMGEGLLRRAEMTQRQLHHQKPTPAWAIAQNSSTEGFLPYPNCLSDFSAFCDVSDWSLKPVLSSLEGPLDFSEGFWISVLHVLRAFEVIPLWMVSWAG